MHMILALGGAMPGELVIFAQECRKSQLLEVMCEQDLWCVCHDLASDISTL